MTSKALRLSDFVSFLPLSAPSAERRLEWGLPHIAGRIVELSGAGAMATLTVAFGLVLDAQKRGESVAWVRLPQSTFYPPDAEHCGVDLKALAVVRVPGAAAAGRAAAQLLRSGAFGLVVIDFGWKPKHSPPLEIPTPLQTRLVGLAQKHDTALVVLTEKPRHAPSLSSLVSLRAETLREEVGGRGTYELKIRILKDKRHGPGKCFKEVCRGPDGLC